MEASLRETGSRFHYHHLRQHNAVAELGGQQFHYGAMAVRVYLVAFRLVSLQDENNDSESLPSKFHRPIACMTWLILSFALLHLMKESIQIYHAQDPSIKYSIWELLSLPYSFDSKIFSERHTSLSALPSHRGEVKATKSITADVIEPENGPHDLIHRQHQISPPILTMERSGTTLLYGNHRVAIRIVMPSNFGPRSWRCYEAIIEASAVGIYLYATFVLTSTLFLNADRAMIYATIMTLCLSAVRIMSILF
jgi:hypothetical protein